ncbi:MAG: translocation/assembly module TamB [candidate division WOR-3 bacterium]|uniref:Translocation and assembly module TamB C-terminal domain-containing protein n=1 Tax=candidate division WOR-3 bacterium TaxID=2052148 RepID=A0A7C1NCG3_UNCW3|nr:translocation/assembly module TamB [candidate division WOR-3 bacterium]
MRILRRIVIYFLGAVVVVLITGFMLRQQLARLVIRRTVAGLSRSINGFVVYEGIEGDIFSSPGIRNLKVMIRSDTYSFELVKVRYDLRSLLQRRIVLKEVDIINPDIRIAAGDTGGGTSQFKPIHLPNIAVHRLQIHNCRVWYDRQLRIDSAGFVLGLDANGTRLVMKVDSVHFRLTKEKISVARTGALITLVNDSLTVRNLEILTAHSRFTADGYVNLATGAVVIDRAELGVSLQEILKIPGQAQLRGSVHKTGGERRVELNGWVADLEQNELKLPRLTGACTLADSLLELKISGGSPELGAVVVNGRFNLSNFLFRAAIVMESVPVNRFMHSLPEFGLSARLDAYGRLNSLGQMLKMPDAGKGSDSLVIRLNGSASELGVETLAAVINYEHQAVELRELFIDGPAGRFNFVGRAKKGMLLAQCEMSGFDLKIAGKFLKVGLSGRADGRLRMTLAGDSWGFSGLVRVAGFGANGFEVTTGLIQADLSGRGGGVGLRLGEQVSGRLAVGGEGVKLAGREWNWAQFVWTGPEFDLQFEEDSTQLRMLGDVSLESSGLSAVIRDMNLVIRGDTVSLIDSCEVALHRDTLAVNGVRLSIAGGETEFELELTAGSISHLYLIGHQLNLKNLATLAGLKLDVSGSADISVAGSDSLTVDLKVDGLKLPAAELDFNFLKSRLAIFRNNVDIDYIKFVHHIDTSEIKGVLRYEWQPVLSIRQADLTVVLADPGNWILKVTRPYVEIPEGRIYALVQADWEPGMLNLSGRARVNDGVLIVPSVAARAERIQAELSFQKDRIVLEKLSGVTTRGVLTAEGFVQLNPALQVESLRYQTHFTGVSAVPIPAVYAIGSGDITVSWREGELALISGEARIDDALATIGFGGQPGAGGNGGSDINYDIRVRGERGLWLRNPQADIELGVDLTVRKIGEDVLYSGEMVSRQGRIYYLDHTLQLTEGRLLFDNVSSFNPQLDLTAELPVSGRHTNGPERLRLRVTGSLQEPVFAFSAEPPVWDETQIITYLSLNVTMDELSAMEQKELLSRLLAERVLGYFQTQVSKRVRDYISLDYLELETGLGGSEAARVTVGKYVTRNLYVSYTQSFADDFQPAFRIEYYLNRRNELVAERSMDGRYSLRYRFKLRF